LARAHRKSPLGRTGTALLPHALASALLKAPFACSDFASSRPYGVHPPSPPLAVRGRGRSQCEPCGGFDPRRIPVHLHLSMGKARPGAADRHLLLHHWLHGVDRNRKVARCQAQVRGLPRAGEAQLWHTKRPPRRTK
jgi:hypothetical protein